MKNAWTEKVEAQDAEIAAFRKALIEETKRGNDYLGEIAGLKAEVERLKAKFIHYCTFCGEFFAPGKLDYEAMKRHSETCEKHPMFALKSRAESAEAVVEKVRAAIDGGEEDGLAAWVIVGELKAIIWEGEK